MNPARLLLIPLCLSVSSVVAQITDLAKLTENKVLRDQVKPNWLLDSKSFWYRVQVGPQTHEFVLIHAETGTRKTAKSLKELGLPENEALKTSATQIELHPTRRTGEESGIKFINQLGENVDLFWINQARCLTT